MRRVLIIGGSFILVLALATAAIRARQGKSKRPSPPATANCDLPGGKSVTVDYSRPQMKGRKIFGGLVPYGQVWRAGANEATTFVTTADLIIGGKHVPAGSYTLFTIPDRDKWTIIISKKTGEWGIPYPEGSDLLRLDMTAGAAPALVESFTIAFESGGNGCTLRMEWENTRATVDIATM
ncbi:MAG TPA: DUF2911 domain-containing protein [Candidatus Acidoferrales bacterium]|jgi:hypothetical protein|nr:DUF2911 domain-containing protein [Candidatus Acidoferrales bacterium]